MKKIFMMMALAATALFTVTACGGDDDDDNGVSNNNTAITLPTPKYKNDAIKFSVPNAEVTLDGKAVKLKQLELTESGRFMLTYETTDAARETRGTSLTEYLMGLFTKDGDGYKLANFGYIKFQAKNGNNYLLTIIPTGGTSFDIDVVKLDPLAPSALNDYLCRTWNITNTRIIGNINNVNVAKDFTGRCNMADIIEYVENKGIVIKEKPDPDKTIIDGITFTYSKSYIINYTSGKADVGTWRWTQQLVGSGALAYDWDGNHMGFEPIKHTAVVTFEGNQCKMQLPVSDANYSVELVYTIVPAN
jgi:hypothetical protein